MILKLTCAVVDSGQSQALRLAIARALVKINLKTRRLFVQKAS